MSAGERTELATEPLQPDRSLGDLFGQLTADMSELFRQEVELAKTEARQEVARAGKAGAMFGGAALGGLMAISFLSFALAWLLDQAMNTALSFLIVGVLWAILAWLLLSTGKRQLADIQVLPETVSTLKEDVQWFKTQKS